jgi:hypothetical protein
MHPFRAVVEARQFEAIRALLADDVPFLSPVALALYSRRELVVAFLRGASRAFEEFRYEREIASPDGRDHALIFKARIGDREVHGCEFLHLDERGLIDQFLVMVRPLSHARAVSEPIAAQFGIVKSELGMAA